MSNPVDLSDFVAGFLLEAEEHLHAVNRNLVVTAEALKKGLPEPRAVRDLFRSLHTIKGLAAMVGAEPIVDISHELEDLLRSADRSGGRLNEPMLDLVLQGTRAIEERIRILAQRGMAHIPPAPAQLMELLTLAQRKDAPAARSVHDFEITVPEEMLRALSAADREQLIQAGHGQKRITLLEFRPSPEKAALGLNITSVRERLAKIGELVKVVPRASPTAPTGIAFSLLLITESSDPVLAETIGGTTEDVKLVAVNASPVTVAATPESIPATLAEAEAPAAEWLPTAQSSIRVDVRRLDEALEQLSGLFVTRFKLERAVAGLATAGADVRDLKAVIAENTRQLRRLRSAISEARMVPLAELLQRLPLVVRGITKNSNKSVNVTIHAGSTEVDKAVADKLFPAVVHLVRNAVDHAIESHDERRAAQKPQAGELSIVCDDSSGTNVILTISDDGRGIDREAVARKAGLPMARTDEELLQQICTAGLSTSSAVTHTSGRGMGMEIVKRTVEILGGSVTLKTEPGRGTKMTLRVPVSVTIVDVLSFVSGAQVFVAPVAIVDEIVEVEPTRSITMPAASDHGPRTHLIQHRGKTIPLIVLQSVLNRAHRQTVESIPPKALVVSLSGGSEIAFGIDRMLGKQEAVVRPLDDALVRVPGLAGATDLGDGCPTLVLDLATLGTSFFQSSQIIHSNQPTNFTQISPAEGPSA